MQVCMRSGSAIRTAITKFSASSPNVVNGLARPDTQNERMEFSETSPITLPATSIVCPGAAYRPAALSAALYRSSMTPPQLGQHTKAVAQASAGVTLRSAGLRHWRHENRGIKYWRQ